MKDLELRIDPQFVNRGLAAQALGAPSGGDLGEIADQVARRARDAHVTDLRTAVMTADLSSIVGQLTTVRAGFYFKPVPIDGQPRVRFHTPIKVDERRTLRVTGVLDPGRYETSSASTNLSGRENVYIVGMVRNFDAATDTVEIRPMLIGYAYFAPADAERVDPERSFHRRGSRQPGIPVRFDRGRPSCARDGR